MTSHHQQQQPPLPPLPQQDRTIIATADDAILAKLATVQAGYYDDPYLEPLSRHASGIAESSAATAATSGQGMRHPPGRGGGRSIRQVQPIIKRGTHARVCCMDRAISAFVDYYTPTEECQKTNQNVQIIVLGSGKDTSFFRLAQANVQWYEVDHPSVIHTKANMIQQSVQQESSPNVFSSIAVQPTETGYRLTKSLATTSDATVVDADTNNEASATTTTTASSAWCHLIGHDLRDNPQTLIDKLGKGTAFDPTAPTLLLLECVMMYLPDDASRSLLKCLTSTLSSAYLACYEPILGEDSFGKVMESNLSKAGVVARDACLTHVRTLPQQLEKVLACGFTTAVGSDMSSAYESILTPAQRGQANRAELLDEVEEWLLIMRHYCFFCRLHDGRQGLCQDLLWRRCRRRGLGIFTQPVRDHDEETIVLTCTYR